MNGVNDATKKLRIAAIGDLHVKKDEQGKWVEYFRMVSGISDVLLICGDLTDTGTIEEAEILSEDIKSCSVPVVAVLGNHDYQEDMQEEIKKILSHENVFILDGDSVVIRNVGFAGVKGFGGGFDKYMLRMWGEYANKSYVQESVNETSKLETALDRLDKHNPACKKNCTYALFTY